MDATAEELQNRWPRKALRFPARKSTTRQIRRRSDFFWNDFVGKLFAQGWDAFWLDSSEPEEAWPHVGDAILRYMTLHIGSGLEYTNIFPLEHTGGVQEHWKETNPDKRVFILTRSAFAGQQRNGATVWSGDVYSSWWALRRQVPAGLNFALSGYPYWTTDIGGYHPLFAGQANSRHTRSSTPAGLSTARSAPFSAPMGIGITTRCGPIPQVFPALAGDRPPALPAAALRLLTGLESHQ